MFLYFDSTGKLQEIVNDKALRVGNANLNKLYIFVEGGNVINNDGVILHDTRNDLVANNATMRFQLPDGTKTIEMAIEPQTTELFIPYDKHRDLKFFKDFDKYAFFVAILPSSSTDSSLPNVLEQNGLVACTIKFIRETDIFVLGIITFIVENAVIEVEHSITLSQWNYLLLKSQKEKTDKLNIFDELPDAMDFTEGAVVGIKKVNSSGGYRHVEFYQKANDVWTLLNTLPYLYTDTFDDEIGFSMGTYIPFVWNFGGYRTTLRMNTSDRQYYEINYGTIIFQDKRLNTAKIIATEDSIKQYYGLKGQPNGVAPLNANGKISSKYLPTDGALFFGGVAGSLPSGSQGVYCELSQTFKDRFGESSRGLTITENENNIYEGTYFLINSNAFIPASSQYPSLYPSITLKPRDNLLSLGSRGWIKIDNNDDVIAVNDLTGSVILHGENIKLNAPTEEETDNPYIKDAISNIQSDINSLEYTTQRIFFNPVIGSTSIDVPPSFGVGNHAYFSVIGQGGKIGITANRVDFNPITSSNPLNIFVQDSKIYAGYNTTAPLYVYARTMTQAEYDSLTTKDENMTYYIIEG